MDNIVGAYTPGSQPRIAPVISTVHIFIQLPSSEATSCWDKQLLTGVTNFEKQHQTASCEAKIWPNLLNVFDVMHTFLESSVICQNIAQKPVTLILVVCFSVHSPGVATSSVAECLVRKAGDGDAERFKSVERMRVVERELVRSDTSELQMYLV